jgi:hypothetical protein
MLHVNPLPCPGSTPRQVAEGEPVGTIENLTIQYPGITPHAHVEVYMIKNGVTTRINPSTVIP